MPQSAYARFITEDLASLGLPAYNPAHVEAWMRLEYGTLDSLSPAQFRREVAIAAACIVTAEPGASDRLAASFGLTVDPHAEPEWKMPPTQGGGFRDPLRYEGSAPFPDPDLTAASRRTWLADRDSDAPFKI